MSKIVIADHDGEFREMAVFALRFAGHEAVGASDGEECLRIAKQTQLDLILVDVNLPIANGKDICRALKLDGVTKSIRVVLMHSLGLVLETHTDAGECGEDIIIKPIDIDQLVQRVNSILNK